MHVERYGRGEKALFVHGSGWNVHMWYAIRDRLESSMEVILVDLPGHGASFGEGSNSVQGYSDMVGINETQVDIGICRLRHDAFRTVRDSDDKGIEIAVADDLKT